MATYQRERYNARPLPRKVNEDWLRQEFLSIQRGIPWPATSVDIRDWNPRLNGTSDDSTALQGALSALGTAGGTIKVPAGTLAYGSSVSPLGGRVRIEGEEMDATILHYTGTTGAGIVLGSFDGVKDFSSTPACQQFALSKLTLKGGYNNTTVAGRAFGTPYGIIDYESGHLRIDRVRAQGFATVFWGIASDFNNVNDFMAILNGTVFDLRNRCDQGTYIACKGYGNHNYFHIRGCASVRIIRPDFIENTGVDVIVGGAEETVADPRGGGNYTGVVTPSAFSVSVVSPWLEVYRTANNGAAWAVGQPTKPAFFDVGNSTATAQARPVQGVVISDVSVHGVADEAGATAITECLVRAKYSDDVLVDGLEFEHDFKWPVAINEDASAFLSGSRIVRTGGIRLRRVTRRERYAEMTPPLIEAAAHSLTADTGESQRHSIIGNPTLMGGAAPYGWALTNMASAAYSITGSERSLGGTPITLTPAAANGSLRFNTLRLRPYALYEVVVRYKTSADSADWMVRLDPDPLGAGAPSNVWHRELQPRTVFAEYRFLVPTYDIATIAVPRLNVQYLGSTLTDTLTLDYLDVIEWAPFDARVRVPIGNQSPGSLSVADGQYAIHGKRLALSGTERATLAGSARLVICG